MIFPEIRGLLKRFTPDNGALLALNLKSDYATFSSTAEENFYRKYPQIYAILSGGLPTWAAEPVTLRTALGHPVIYACNKIISEIIGSTPASLMRKKGKNKDVAEGHPMQMAMHHMPNEEISAQRFIETATSHCVLQGNSFAKITRRSGTGTALSLDLLLPQQVKVDREKTGSKRLVYIVLKETGAVDRTYTVVPGKPHDIFHMAGIGWDGVCGYSVIDVHRETISAALAAEKHVALFWRNGARVPYILEMEGRFKDKTEADMFRKDWAEIVSNGGIPIAQHGIKYKQTGSDMTDAQALETRQWTVSVLCRPFGVSPHLVHDLSRATFSNVEHLGLQFVKMTLAPWLKRWEDDFFRCVLTPEEREQNYFLNFNLNALLRGDFATRMAGFSTALQNGFLTIDEVRDLEDRNPAPGGAGSHHHIQTNMGTLSRDGQVVPPTQPGLIRLDDDSLGAA